MNTPHEQPVDNGSALSPLPPQSALQDPGPESPPPVGMQAASFKAALRIFREGSAEREVREPKRSRLEIALRKDMRGEAARPARQIVDDYTPVAPPVKGTSRLMVAAAFIEWARELGAELTATAIVERWGGSRARAYRWRAAALSLTDTR
jgi:hypothetical protein